MTIVTVSALTMFIVTLLPAFSRPDFKWVRGSLFITLGITISSPLLYAIFNL